MNRNQIARILRDGVPESIHAAAVELLAQAVDDNAGDLLVAGVSLLVEPFAYPKPTVALEPMAGPLPHPLEIAAFVRRHGGNHALTKPHVPARNAIDIWRSCPSALTCRAEFRHAIRTFHVHITMPDGRNKAALSATRALKQVAIASMGCLLNPQSEPFE